MLFSHPNRQSLKGKRKSRTLLQTDASGTCETSYSVRSEKHSYAHSHEHHDIACGEPGFYNVSRSRDFRNCTRRPLKAHAFLFGADRSDEQLARVRRRGLWESVRERELADARCLSSTFRLCSTRALSWGSTWAARVGTTRSILRRRTRATRSRRSDSCVARSLRRSCE